MIFIEFVTLKRVILTYLKRLPFKNNYVRNLISSIETCYTILLRTYQLLRLTRNLIRIYTISWRIRYLNWFTLLCNMQSFTAVQLRFKLTLYGSWVYFNNHVSRALICSYVYSNMKVIKNLIQYLHGSKWLFMLYSVDERTDPWN